MNAKVLKADTNSWSEAIRRLAFRGHFEDLTLSSREKPENTIKCHRLIVASFSQKICSELLKVPLPSQNCITLGVKHDSLVRFIELVYKGSVEVPNNCLESFSDDLRLLNVGRNLGEAVAFFAENAEIQNLPEYAAAARLEPCPVPMSPTTDSFSSRSRPLDTSTTPRPASCDPNSRTIISETDFCLRNESISGLQMIGSVPNANGAIAYPPSDGLSGNDIIGRPWVANPILHTQQIRPMEVAQGRFSGEGRQTIGHGPQRPHVSAAPVDQLLARPNPSLFNGMDYPVDPPQQPNDRLESHQIKQEVPNPATLPRRNPFVAAPGTELRIKSEVNGGDESDNWFKDKRARLSSPELLVQGEALHWIELDNRNRRYSENQVLTLFKGCAIQKVHFADPNYALFGFASPDAANRFYDQFLKSERLRRVSQSSDILPQTKYILQIDKLLPAYSNYELRKFLEKFKNKYKLERKNNQSAILLFDHPTDMYDVMDFWNNRSPCLGAVARVIES